MKIAFITGLSDWGNTSLSPEQTEFLHGLKSQEQDKIYYNFPYNISRKVYKNTNIILASLSNGIQYFLARTKWLDKKTELLKQIIKQQDKILLLSGSCGLELLNNMKFSKEEKQKIHIIAYGGVATKIPDFPYVTLVQGDKDYIARIWITVYDVKIQCHHMNYLQSTQLLNFVNDYIEKMESDN